MAGDQPVAKRVNGFLTLERVSDPPQLHCNKQKEVAGMQSLTDPK